MGLNSATFPQSYRHGYLRQGDEIYSSARGLFITLANIENVFRQYPDPEQKRAAARDLWNLLAAGSLCLPSGIINELPRIWVGIDGEDDDQSSQSNTVYLQVEFYYHIDLEWKQRRELVFVAVADDAINQLFTYTHIEDRFSEQISTQATNVDPDVFVRFIQSRKQKTADRNFRGAISRALQRIVVHSNYFNALEELPVRSASCVGYVHSMCEEFGSSIYNMPGRVMRAWHNHIPDKAPISPFNFLNSISTSENLILVVGDSDLHDWEGVNSDEVAPSLCLFAFNEPADHVQEDRLIRALTLVKSPHFRTYHTVLRGRYFNDTAGMIDNQVGSQRVLKDDEPHGNNLRPRQDSIAGVDAWIAELSSLL